MIAVPAAAKLNLRLAVLAREDSGFHQIESVFCALELADEIAVEVGRADGITLYVEGASLGPVEDNLVYRAAAAFFDAVRRPPRARIRLRKRIPAGAGLGGGSSDAAATLRALQRLHREPLGADALLEIGGRLGSDVPFFLADAPFALAWGRGQRMLRLPPLPAAPVLLAVPDAATRTAEAYEALDRRRRGRDAASEPRLLPLHAFESWQAVAAIARNDFEPVVFERVPGLGEIRARLEAEHATIARLTGTGSAVFAVFADATRRDAAAAALRERFDAVRFIETRTAEAGVAP